MPELIVPSTLAAQLSADTGKEVWFKKCICYMVNSQFHYMFDLLIAGEVFVFFIELDFVDVVFQTGSTHLYPTIYRELLGQIRKVCNDER